MRFTYIISFGFAVIGLLVTNLALADPAAGEGVFNTNSCGSCHYTQGPATERKPLPISWPSRGPNYGMQAASFSNRGWSNGYRIPSLSAA